MSFLFPSWRFFDKLDELPRLFYRFCYKKNDEVPKWGEWLESPAAPTFSRARFFLNSKVTLHHATHSLVERALNEWQGQKNPDSRSFSTAVSYQQLVHLVSHYLTRMSRQDRPTICFQFKISVEDLDTHLQKDVLMSEIHEV